MQYSSVSATALLADSPASQPIAEKSIQTPYVLTIDDDEAIVNVILSLLATE